MSLVQTAAARPYSLLLARGNISSGSLNGIAVTTGPKISSRTTFMSSRVFTRTVGSTKYPLLPFSLSAGKGCRALRKSGFEISANAVELLLGNERTHAGLGIETGTDLDFLGVVGHSFHNTVENGLFYIKSRPGATTLTVIEKDRAGSSGNSRRRGRHL